MLKAASAVVLVACTANLASAVPCNPHGEWRPVSGQVSTDPGTGVYGPPRTQTDYEYVHLEDDCPPAGGGSVGGGGLPPQDDVPPPPPYNAFDQDNNGLADCWVLVVATADPQAPILLLGERFGSEYGGPNPDPAEHSGIDVQCDPGDTVMSIARGWVETVHYYSGNPVTDRRGNSVTIRHFDGRTSIYCHLESFAAGIRSNIQAEVGMPIGTCGTTGNSSGHHVHLIMQDASPSSPFSDYIDPETNLPCP